MKNKLIIVSALTLLIVSCLTVGCAKKKESNVSISTVMEKMQAEADFKNPTLEDLTNIQMAERYGVAPDSIEAGYCYASTGGSADEILLIKAKEDDHVQELQRSLSAEVTKLAKTWEHGNANESSGDNAASYTESEKVKNHILKSRGKYVVLIVAQDAKKIEKAFDSIV